MPLFISYVSYSNAGIKGMVDKPRAWKMSDFPTIAEKAAKLASVYVPPGK